MPRELLTRMVLLLDDLHCKTNVERAFGGAGSPWEFNLRDLLRWCHLAESAMPPFRCIPSALYHCTVLSGQEQQLIHTQSTRSLV